MLDVLNIAGLWQNNPFALSVFTSSQGPLSVLVKGLDSGTVLAGLEAARYGSGISVFRGGDGFPPHVLTEGSLRAVSSRISLARTTEVGNEKRNIN